MNERRSTLSGYARRVEQIWVERLQRAVVLSPRDFRCIRAWHEDGIPLQIVQETLDALFERKRGAPPRALARIDVAVRESWNVVLEGRVAAESEGGGDRQAPSAASATAIDRWRRAREADSCGESLRHLLDQLIKAYDAGTEPAEIDRRLDEALADVAPAATRDAATSEVAAGLVDAAPRMDPIIERQTRDRALASALRRRLELPRLDS